MESRTCLRPGARVRVWVSRGGDGRRAGSGGSSRGSRRGGVQPLAGTEADGGGDPGVVQGLGRLGGLGGARASLLTDTVLAGARKRSLGGGGGGSAAGSGE